MRKRAIVGLMILIFIGCNESTVQKEELIKEKRDVPKEDIVIFSKNVFSPEEEVLCDKKSQFCSDSHGISLGFTKEFISEEAQKIWLKRMTKDFSTTVFTMSDGIHCDTNQKICKKSKWDEKIDVVITRRLFGN